VRESFRSSSHSGGHDGESRAIRYLEWDWDPDPSDESFQTDFAYILRDENGSVRVEQDRHVLGLFPEEVWIRLLGDVGFDVRREPVEYEEKKPDAGRIFVGVRPS
jgi:hypothetical protein